MAERGPFNVVFHGIQPDWIEEEMADDIDFKKDVLEQRIRTIIRDQVQCFCSFIFPTTKMLLYKNVVISFMMPFYGFYFL